MRHQAYLLLIVLIIPWNTYAATIGEQKHYTGVIFETTRITNVTKNEVTPRIERDSNHPLDFTAEIYNVTDGIIEYKFATGEFDYYIDQELEYYYSNCPSFAMERWYTPNGPYLYPNYYLEEVDLTCAQRNTLEPLKNYPTFVERFSEEDITNTLSKATTKDNISRTLSITTYMEMGLFFSEKWLGIYLHYNQTASKDTLEMLDEEAVEEVIWDMEFEALFDRETHWVDHIVVNTTSVTYIKLDARTMYLGTTRSTKQVGTGISVRDLLTSKNTSGTSFLDYYMPAVALPMAVVWRKRRHKDTEC